MQFFLILRTLKNTKESMTFFFIESNDYQNRHDPFIVNEMSRIFRDYFSLTLQSGISILIKFMYGVFFFQIKNTKF